MKRFLPFLLLVAGFLSLSPNQMIAQGTSDKTVVEIAVGNDNFSTLVAAVKAAGLVETLSGDGPFTVFAPTDEAFAALPEGLVAALVKPENKAVLQKILTYHVVSGKLMASDVVAGIKSSNGMLNASTVEGGDFTVMTDMGKVKIKDAQGNVATVTATDIAGSNGVIHVIDRVMLPTGVNPADLLKKGAMMATKAVMAPKPTGPTIVAVASGNDNFTTLVAALGAAGLVETFDSPGEYTVFAPTDDAFAKLPEGLVNTLVTTEKAQLKGILAYHVIPARITAAQLVGAIKKAKNYYQLQTLSNQTLIATMKDGNVQLIDGNGNRSTIIITDVEASNGIIHAIDSVVTPKS
ncbi:MAG: putative surface protein with fasciclin (FAS1) repeats [Neolewinella sp.]|jgi:transforming growth factor-beta-induced protein